jgi:hypothetical protein
LEQVSGGLVDKQIEFNPNMVSGVTLDSTFVSSQQFRYLPTVAANVFTCQFTTPNWVHPRSLALNLQYIFRLGGEIYDGGNYPYFPTESQNWQRDPITTTGYRIKDGAYHMTNGGLLSVLRNMKIKLGAQVDIMTAFEKTKCGFHILNCWLRGKWDQKNVFALIDRWDAWYGYQWGNYTQGTKEYFGVPLTQGINNFTPYVPFTSIPHQQSDCPYERWLSRVLADRGLCRETNSVIGGDDGLRYTDRFNEFVENVTMSFDKLHALFQQNMMIPPGTQFIIEFEMPIYPNYVPGKVVRFPPNATWMCLGYVCEGANQEPVVVPPNDIEPQPVYYWPFNLAILTTLNPTSTFNSIVCNCVNLRPEIARSLQEARISSPLIYNYKQMVSSTLGRYFNGQPNYDFTMPPDQCVPSQFYCAWIYRQAGSSQVFVPGEGQLPITQRWALETECMNPASLYGKGVGQGMLPYAFDGPAPTGSQMIQNNHVVYTSYTPLPVVYKRLIVSRGGFQEFYLYNTYYDGVDNTLGYACVEEQSQNKRAIQNAVRLPGVHNLTCDSSQEYMDRLQEYEYGKSSLNGLGEVERLGRWSYTPKMYTEGKWQLIQLNPMKQDLGKFPVDASRYTLNIRCELDFSVSYAENNMMLKDAQELFDYWSPGVPEFVVVRVLPAQISIAIDGTVRQYVWPNLLVNPNEALSVHPPPAAAGGSI